MELRLYARIIWRWKWVFLGILASCILIPLAQAYLVAPIYESSARVMINRKDIQSAFTKSVPDTHGELFYLDADNVPENYLQQFQDSSVLEAVVNELKLDVKVSKLHTNYPYFKFMGLLQDKAVRVKQVEESEVLEVRSYSTTAAEAGAMANLLVKTTVDRWYAERRRTAALAREVLERSLAETAVQLRQAEGALEGFLAQEGISDIDEEIGNLGKQIVTYDYDLYKLKGALEASEKEQLAVQKAMKGVPQFQKAAESMRVNPVVDKAKTELADLLWTLAGKSAEITENHPEVIALKSQIESVKATLKAEAMQTLFSEDIVRDDYHQSLLTRYSDSEIDRITNQIKFDMTERDISIKKEQMVLLATKQVEYGRLSNELSRLRDTDKSLRTAIESTKMAEKMEIANVKILHPADEGRSDVYFPSSKKTIVAVGFMLGLAFAFFLTLYVDYLNDGCKDIRDVEAASGMRVSHSVPRFLRFRRARALADDPASRRMQDALWNVATLVENSGLAGKPRVIAVTSCTRGEGKTVAGVFLARALAGGGRVLLAEFNARRPGLADTLGARARGTLQDVIGGRLPLAEACTRDGEHLDLLAAGRDDSPLRLFGAPSVDRFMSQAGDYDWVVLDLSSLEDDKAAVTLARRADLVLVIVAFGATRQDQLAQAIAELKGVKGESGLMIVTNKA